MTPALAAQCRRAVHVVTPDGAVISAGRASLYVIEQIGWRTVASIFRHRPFIWLVEGGYWLVARNRGLIGRLFFRS